MLRIFKHYIPVNLVLVGLFEACLFYFAVPFARYLNPYDSNSIDHTIFTELTFSIVTILSLFATGLYGSHLRDNFRGLVFRIVLVIVSVFFLMSFLFYLHPALFTARTTFVYALIVMGSALLITRSLLFYIIDQKFFQKKIIVYGAGHKANHLNELRRKSDMREINIAGFLPIEGEQIHIKKDKLLTFSGSLSDYVRENNIVEIIVAIDDRRKKFSVDDVLECKVHGINVLDISTFFERQTGRIKLQALQPSNLIFSDGFFKGTDYFKRVVDITFSLLLLPFALPFMLLAALAILIESKFKGTIFYRQVRVGLYNKNFEVIKFRSMSMDAEKNGAQWATKSDPRITRVGNILRKYRIDELPQLLNVLKGDMSFVGPRPERPEFVKELSKKIKYYEIRHYVKPGITGWAQVCYSYGATEDDSRNKLEYDLYYMKNYSMFLDILILLRTVQVVVWQQGAR